MPQTADGVKPVCTVVYNDFPLTFTKAQVFVRSNAYTFRGEYTRQAGALAAVTLPEYSFDGENWIREGENNIFRADDGYYIAFPCDQWDVSANPYIYIRLRGETEEQVYYSNVLRYAANNMDIAEDLGGSRGGGTSIVNPPEEPEKPGESGKPEESERPGESGKPEESERPGESEKPEELEKSCESQKSAEPRKLPKQENANEPDVPEKTPEPAEKEYSQTSSETFGWSNPKDGGAPDFAAQAKPDLLPQTESGNMAAGQPGNYGLIVGIVLLSAVVGAVCIFDLVRYL